MSIVITEKRDRSITRSVRNNANRTFDCIGASSEDAALDALATTPWNIARNSAYSTGDPRLCESVAAKYISNGTYELTASYAVQDTGSVITDAPNSLSKPPFIVWQTVTVQEPFDRDTAGYPITNSARDPLATPGTKSYSYKSLKITINKQFYDYATWTPYENTVNSASVTTTEPNGHTVVIPAEAMKCVSIEPAAGYDSTATVIPITWSFEVYDLTNISTNYPHQFRMMDQGVHGFYGAGSPPTKGNIFNADGTEIAQDVRLGGTGKPMDTTLKIGKDLQAPVTVAAPSGVIAAESTADAVFLVWRRYKAVSFATIFNGGTL